MKKNNKDNPDQNPAGDVRKAEILAPAGNRDSFLAAIAAGADAVYCGLKSFSARMKAENFTIDELGPLASLARDRGVKLYATLNSLLKNDDIEKAGTLIVDLKRRVRPDAFIISDLGLVDLLAQAGYRGEIHLSTLAAVTFPGAVSAAGCLPGVKRIVLPREFSIDEIKETAGICPETIGLEVFVHGALCYGVSGRCYWSSYFGGKSGLRGWCVQPCRRLYRQGNASGKFFSCADLHLDFLAKLLFQIPQIAGIKIEGRKKGPHYVYHTVKAYRMLRDHAGEPGVKKEVAACLDYALGRSGTHYNFLSQRQWNPIDERPNTGSGRLVGRVSGPLSRPRFEAREPLLAGDMVRIGTEDSSWHRTLKITCNIPKGVAFTLPLSPKERPANGTPVFLVDRRETGLADEIKKLSLELEKKKKKPPVKKKKPAFKPVLPGKSISRRHSLTVRVSWDPPDQSPPVDTGVWLSDMVVPGRTRFSPRLWWWLPPVIWPDDAITMQKKIEGAVKKGFRRFVLNSPWQISLFPRVSGLELWAGPFCNIANCLAIETLAFMGFYGVIVSPELGKKDYAALPSKSPLALGIIIKGFFPLCISRTVSQNLKLETPFVSPRGEAGWAVKRGSCYWIYPDWPIDITRHETFLKRLGYQMFVHLEEVLPRKVRKKNRQGLWNWEIGLK